MPAYIIINSTLTKPELFQKYVEASEDSLNLYNGTFLLGGMVSEVLEGNHDKKRTVIIEFPSSDKAKEWYNSAEYAKVKPLRENTGSFDFVLIDSF